MSYVPSKKRSMKERKEYILQEYGFRWNRFSNEWQTKQGAYATITPETVQKLSVMQLLKLLKETI